MIGKLDELVGYTGALVKHLIDAGGARAMAHLAGLTVNRACTSTAALVYADADGLVTFTHSRPGTVADVPAGHAGRLSLWTVYIGGVRRDKTRPAGRAQL